MSTFFLSSVSGVRLHELHEEATVSVGDTTLKPVAPEQVSEPEGGIAKELEGGQRHDADNKEDDSGGDDSEPEGCILEEVEGGQRHDADNKKDNHDDEGVSEALKAMLMQAIAGLCLQDMGASSNAGVTTISESRSVAAEGMVDTVLQYLGGRSYEVMPRREDGRQVIIVSLTGTHASFRTYIDIRIPENRMSVFVVCPLKVPFHRRADVIELLMRANFSLSLGNLELDMDDGEVRMRSAVDVDGSTLSVQMVETYIMATASTMDRFFPAVMKVVYDTTTTPKQAFQEIVDQLL